MVTGDFPDRVWGEPSGGDVRLVNGAALVRRVPRCEVRRNQRGVLIAMRGMVTAILSSYPAGVGFGSLLVGALW